MIIYRADLGADYADFFVMSSVVETSHIAHEKSVT